MPGIVTDQGVVHYEVYGQGKPLILLHGWLGSWRLWQPTMEALALDGYRCYALDFWGFGESGKKRASYSVDDFSSLVGQFMANMGIAKAPLIGHSMGGTVSLATALRYPQTVSKVVVIGSPIRGAALAPALKLAANPLIARLLFSQLPLFSKILHLAAPLLCSFPGFAGMLTGDMNKTTLESFFKSIASLKQTDLVGTVKSIQMEVLGLYGKGDNIVSPKEYETLLAAIPGSKGVLFPSAKHFIMLDDQPGFLNELKNFLAGNQPIP